MMIDEDDDDDDDDDAILKSSRVQIAKFLLLQKRGGAQRDPASTPGRCASRGTPPRVRLVELRGSVPSVVLESALQAVNAIFGPNFTVLPPCSLHIGPYTLFANFFVRI